MSLSEDPGIRTTMRSVGYDLQWLHSFDMSNVNVKLARSGPSQTLGAVLYQGDKVLQGGYYSKLNIEHVQYGSREVIDVVLWQEVSSGAANGEGGLQTAMGHAPDVDEDDLFEGHPPTARRRERLADLVEGLLRRQCEH